MRYATDSYSAAQFHAAYGEWLEASNVKVNKQASPTLSVTVSSHVSRRQKMQNVSVGATEGAKMAAPREDSQEIRSSPAGPAPSAVRPAPYARQRLPPRLPPRFRHAVIYVTPDISPLCHRGRLLLRA